MQATSWGHRLEVTADGHRIIGHAGTVWLRKTVDKVGLTSALGPVFGPGSGYGWIDRGQVPTHLAVTIAAGAVNISDAERLSRHQHGLFGATGSDSTIHRTVEAIGTEEKLHAALARARSKVREHVRPPHKEGEALIENPDELLRHLLLGARSTSSDC